MQRSSRKLWLVVFSVLALAVSTIRNAATPIAQAAPVNAPLVASSYYWSLDTTPADLPGNNLLAVDCWASDGCVAVGQKGAIVKWDGSIWTLLPSPTPDQIDDVSCDSNGHCVAVGTAIIHSGPNGEGWVLDSSPTFNPLSGVSCWSTGCLAVGFPGTAVQWDGTNWTLVMGAPFTPMKVACDSGSSPACEVVGLFGSNFYWNGASWTDLSGTTMYELNDVSCLAGECVAVSGGTIIYGGLGSTPWSEASSLPMLVNYYGVSSGSSWIKAVGDGGVILSSTNGADWTADTVTSGTTTAVTGVSCAPGASTTCKAVSAKTILSLTACTTVTNNANSGTGSLRDAIACAAPGDTITFAPSLAGQTIRLTSASLTLDKNVTIDGSALTTAVTISGDANNNSLADAGDVRLFVVNSGITVFMKGLILTGGYCTGCGGAAISNSGTLNIENSTLANNSDDDWGGAILNWPSGVLSIVNTTLTGNRAGVVGGAISNLGDLTLINSTLAGNGFITSGSGDALYSQGTVAIMNSILTNDTGYACYIAGTVVASSNNLSDISCPGVSVVGDPVIGTLANNGGKTPTMALLPGSPAIDAGDATTCASLPGGDLDQRGVARHDGNADGTATCDIGAYEAGTMQCSVSGGNDYTFSSQSDVALHVNATTDLACLYVEELPINHPNATGATNGQALRTGKYWLIEGLQNDQATTATGFNVNLTLPYSNASATTRVCKWLNGAGSGFGWDCAVDSYNTNTSVTRNGLTSLSQWAVGDTVGPTAVTLTDLSANSQPIELPDLSALAIGALLMAGLGGWWFTRRVMKFR